MNKSTLAVMTLLAMSALVAGCGGGGGSSALPAHPGNTGSQSQARGAAQFTITVPSATTSAGVRRPAYISSNTQSVSIVETDGTATPSPAVVANLTATSPNCSTSSGNVVCAIVVPANAGNDSFTVTTFDALNAGGNQLSTGSLTATIVSGAANTTVPLTLGGIVGSLIVTLADAYAPVGTPTTVSVQAMDASGATIIGSYDNAIALAASGATLGSSSVTNSTAGSSISVTPAGNTVTPIVVTATGDGKTASATLTPGSNIIKYTLGNDGVNDLSGFPATVGPDGKFYYATIGTTICDIVCSGTNGALGQLDPATGAFTEIPMGSEVTSIYFTPDGSLWAAESTAGKLAHFPAGNFTAAAKTEYQVPNSGRPRVITMGADGNLWFTDPWDRRVGSFNIANATFSMYNLPNGPVGTCQCNPNPGGIAAGNDGNLYVTDYYNGVIDQVTTAGVVANQFITSEEVALNPQGGDSFPRFITAGSDGTLYFTQSGEGFSNPYNGRLDSLTTGGTFGNIPLTAYQYQPDSIAAGNGVIAFSDLANGSIGTYTFGQPSPRELPVSDAFSIQTTGFGPQGVALAADGSAWFVCAGAVTSVPMCAGHVVLTSAWSVFPSRTINIYGLGQQSSQLMGIGESGDSSPFTFTSANPAVATAAANSDHNFTITGTGAGSTEITVTDAHGRAVTVEVNVTATEGTVQSLHAKQTKEY